MHSVMVWAASAPPPDRGWGGPAAWVAGAAVCYVIWRVDLWRQQRSKVNNPSPPPPAAPARRETAQVTPVSSHDPGETDPWYGRIVHRGGEAFRRTYRSAKHVAATGESPPKPEPTTAGSPPVVGSGGAQEIDVPLDDDGLDFGESAEEYAAQCLAEGWGQRDVVAALQSDFQVPRSSAYRMVRRLAAEKDVAA